MDDIKEMRSEIDAIDASLAQLYRQRMEVARRIGRFKLEHNLPVDDPQREAQLLTARTAELEPELRPGFERLLRELIRASKRCQRKETDIRPRDAVGEFLSRALFCDELPNGRIGYSGIDGCFAHCAAREILPEAPAQGYNGFEAVFRALGCETDYGVLPIENSSNGSVRAVYSLLQQHQLSVVRSTRLCIRHELLAMPGVKLEDITEIYSHQQAIGQCSRFLSSLSGVRVIPCGNTAEAAKLVAESGSRHAAAISSHPCAALYGLECVSDKIQDSENNYTRFFCVAKDPVIYAGANRISLILSFENKPGALYEILSKLAALDINMTKLESCPVAGSDFEFVFFLELEASVQDPSVLAMLEEMERSCAEFVFLGNYAEV